ncbi:conserved hypothetical protein [Methanococcus vannielii SB]|jgi:hypothetical protein|uniref:KEOPS complex Pcc1-like subunit n=1 Tax=Methanococcus vannielii (strain ATCC 35089 / DSM 1224 / JCM 13029 / OCM 148 / SB) TaxID=406327 RepID=A6USF0_METVS|nr:KEOPS complex subunit Pcc1 [Methanococcus vannielii]ABR55422.1 conserved hypothetical protein [Methanococcus vannielii SB]
MKVNYSMKFKSEKEVIKSLNVDDVNDGLIIKTEYRDDCINLNIITNSTGSLKNILDDFFVNYELVEQVFNLKK